ncbi:Thiamine biosynthesis lipoprotein ApbE precursor [Planctomycetes bacterium Pan216]|uniref:FAD:protein FMN transferase n=1 Tax=Kolteria novifilia TaxID=2527975 RepID=A0A518B9F5_9BACT|nr:Thiamine biosynthesis lipoprotein ApbE precursor [Planctomycetes bacterium Pan216]
MISPSLLLLAGALLLGSSPNDHRHDQQAPLLKRFAYQEPHMGTEFRLVLYAKTEREADDAASAAFARVTELNALLSDYELESDISQLNRAAGGPPRKVSADLFAVVQRSNDFARLSDGAFDISAAPLIREWRRARTRHRLPDPRRLQEAQRLVGCAKIQLDQVRRAIRLPMEGMRLDVGGIAKGYTGDEVLKVLREKGITKAMIDAGGDIVVGDPPPGRPGWTIALQEVPGEPSESIVCHNLAIATSGDTSRFVELEGKRYSHIIDPRTGHALTSRLQVTVIAPSGTEADALASAVSVLGEEEGLALIDEREGVSCRIVNVSGQKSSESRSKWSKRLPITPNYRKKGEK